MVVTLDREQVELGEPVRVTARVRDSTYIDLNDAAGRILVTSPAGIEREVPLEWSVEDDGMYAASFVPDQEGSWHLNAEASRGGSVIGTDDGWVRVGPGDDEFFDAARRTALLERIAEQTGGRSYTAATVDELPEDIQYSGSGVTMVEERDLWDMPVLFLVLIGLIGSEWALRRRRGLI